VFRDVFLFWGSEDPGGLLWSGRDDGTAGGRGNLVGFWYVLVGAPLQADDPRRSEFYQSPNSSRNKQECQMHTPTSKLRILFLTVLLAGACSFAQPIVQVGSLGSRSSGTTQELPND
jgi:hypothetical protein